MNMKRYTEQEWIKLRQNIDFNNIYKKYKKIDNQLDRRAKTILKNEINTNTATTIS